MRRYLAVLLTFILVFSSSASVFAQGKVEVQHYDVSNLENVDEIGENNLDRDTVAKKWADESLNTTSQTIVEKNAAYGTDNWSGNAGEDAFLRNQGGTEKNAQKTYGYLAPTEDVTSLAITVDDGLRLKIDENQDESFEANELLIDEYHIQGATTYTVNVDLEAGKDYKFEIHYFNWGGHGAIEFKANGNDMDLDWFRIDKRPATAPEVSNVHIEIDGSVANEAEIGDQLKGKYDFNDAEDNSDESSYKWYVDDVEQDNTSDTLDVTEDMVNKKIEFEVTAKTDEEPMLGNTEKSNALEVLEPNLYITVDDGYVLYFNGIEVGEDSNHWQSVDSYYVDSVPASDAHIAVKGFDRSNGTATISGFTLAYRTSDDEWVTTDNSWMIFPENEPTDYTFNDITYKWYEEGYKDNEWESARVIEDLNSNWPKSNEKLNDAEAQWIWSDKYQTSEVNPFDSPVYFRNTLLAKSYYDHEKTTLSVDPNVVDDKDFSTATVQIFDQYGTAIDDSNYSVVFFDDGIEINESITYEGNGKYEVTFIPAYGEINKITAEVNNQEVNDFETIKVNKKDQIYTLTLTLTPTQVNEGESVDATVIVKDQYGDLIYGLDVELESNNESVGTMTDEGNGNYDLNFIPNKRGENEIIASFGSASDEGQVNVIVNPMNDAPSIQDESLTTDEDHAVSFTPTTEDIDGDSLDLTIETQGDKGIAVVNNDGSITYTPNENENGDDSFEVLVDDGNGETDKGTIVVIITPLNDGPGMTDQNFEVDEDETLETTIVFSDPEGDSITLEVTTEPNNGDLTFNNMTGEFTYTPDADFNGEDSFVVRAVDENEAETTAIITITVNPVNDAPTIIEEIFVTDEDTPITKKFKVNDIDGDVLEISVISEPLNGTLELGENFEFTYTPDAEFNGKDTFEIKVSDGTLESTGTMTVNVVSVEDIPLAVDDQVSTDANQRITIDVLANDLIGDSTALGITNTSDPSSGSVSVTTDNKILYTPNTNFSGNDSFTYEVTGGSIATVKITINPIEDEDDNNDGGGGGNTGGGGGFIPSSNKSINAETDNLETIKNQPVTTDANKLLANDEDADEITSVENGDNGTVIISGDEITFTPDAEFTGRAYYYYTAENGSDESDRGLVIVTVEEGTIIEPEETPLGNPGDDEMILINPEMVPLGTIDFSDPYIYGYPDDTFRPERSVTRAEIAAIVARILKLNLTDTGQAIYTDVNSNDWFYNYIQSTSQLEIFNGYGDGTFKPNRPVTHAEMATIFSKYWALRNIELPNEQVPYSDIENHWAKNHISRFYNAGVSVGFIDDTFRPNAFTKRSELVVMVNRIIDRPNLEQEIPSFIDVSKEFWGYEVIEAATEGFVPLEQ